MPNRIPSTFRDRLMAAMAAKGKDWPDLAKHVRLTRAGVKKWRDGGHATADNVLKAADYLDVNFRWLLNGTGDMAPPRSLSDLQVQLVDAVRQLPASKQESVQSTPTDCSTA